MLSRSEIDRRELIYLVTDGRAVKIGVSSNMEKRLPALRAEHRKSIRFISAWPCRCARKAEKLIHDALAPFKRIRAERLLEREWFDVAPDVAIAEIEKVLASFRTAV